MTTDESRAAEIPGDPNDEVAFLLRLAGTSDPIAVERIARVRTAVHDAWRTEIEGVTHQARAAKTRRRWLVAAVPLVAAASVAIALVIWGPSRRPAPAPVLVARIDHTTGSPQSFTAGNAVMSGSTVTTSSGTLAMTLTSGVHLRLDASSIARVDSATDVTLERGAVYVDSADAHPTESGPSPISVHTPAGLVRDIGTQFEVRLDDAGMRIRVRDGQVSVTLANGVDARAGAGEELTTKLDGSDRSINRRPIAVTGSDWEWAERAAPPFSVEGKTLGALLDWVSHEGAWTVTFADRGFSGVAREFVVYVRQDLLKGLTPAEALDVVLPTCGLRHRIEGQRVVIERDQQGSDKMTRRQSRRSLGEGGQIGRMIVLVFFFASWSATGLLASAAVSSPVQTSSPTQTSSTVIVAGQVVAGANKAPVAGALVESNDGARRTVTDAGGRFAMNAAPGPLRLEVSAKGFVNQRVDLTVVAGMPAIEIVLTVSPQFRETALVSARGSTLSENAPAAPQIVLQPAAVQRVPGAGDNIFHALQALPGVNATEDWGSRLSVRGGGPDQNLTVMDGVEIHNPYRLFGITSAFTPEIVDRFELTAGGFGAKYGDRLSSILLVDNRQGTTTRRLAWSATSSFTDSNVVVEGKLPGKASGSWLVTGRRTYYDLIAERLARMDFPGFQDVQAKGVWDPKPGHRLTLFVLRSRESADIKEEDEDPDDSQLPTAIGKATRNDLAALSYSMPLGARVSSRTVAAWYRNTDAVSVYGKGFDDSQRSNGCCASGLHDDEDRVEAVFGTGVVDFTRDLNVRDISLRQEFSIQTGAGSRHLFETGFDVHALRTGWGWAVGADMTAPLSAAMRFGVTGDPGPTSPRIDVGVPVLLRSTRDTTRAAVWFQDRYQVRARVLLEPGLRIDRSGLAGETIASPRLGIRFDFTPRTRLRVAIGRYTQSPGYEKLLQSDAFVDLTSADSGQIKSERSFHVIGAIERALTSSVTVRIEAYSKTFDRLIVGRLETEAEAAARVAPYAFPAAIATSVPSAPIVTNNPVNGATGRAYGFDVYVEKPPQSRRDRLSGWASYTFGVADITSYGRQYPFNYDRRHSLSVVGTYWLSRRLDVGATLRVASGFPTTAAVGIRVVATPGPGGSLVPLSLVPLKSTQALYVWTVDRGGVADLNTARLPAYARLDLRVTFHPKKVTGRWQLYVEIFNVLNRKHGRSISYDLQYDPSSDRPRLESRTDGGIPAVPSFGVRYRY